MPPRLVRRLKAATRCDRAQAGRLLGPTVKIFQLDKNLNSDALDFPANYSAVLRQSYITTHLSVTEIVFSSYFTIVFDALPEPIAHVIDTPSRHHE